MIRYQKVGGLHFLRVWRIQMSFCLCKNVNEIKEVAVSIVNEQHDDHVWEYDNHKAEQAWATMFEAPNTECNGMVH